MNNILNMVGGMGNMMQMLGQLKQNPMAMLQRAGMNVPGNITNPQEMIQHLMNSGQISQAQFDNARQMAQMFGMKGSIPPCAQGRFVNN